jgi:hypothetical protein
VRAQAVAPADYWVDLSADHESVPDFGVVHLSASTNAPRDSGLHFYDADTGEVLMVCPLSWWGSQCTISDLPQATRRYYVSAYTWSNTSPNYASGYELARSPVLTVTVEPWTWQVSSLTTNAESVSSDEWATLTATVNRDLTDVALSVAFVDISDPAVDPRDAPVIGRCQEGITCWIDYRPKTLGSHLVTAMLEGVPYPSAASPVQVALQPFTLVLSTDQDAVANDEPAVVTAQLNQPLNDTDYVVDVRDAVSGEVLETCRGVEVCQTNAGVNFGDPLRVFDAALRYVQPAGGCGCGATLTATAPMSLRVAAALPPDEPPTEPQDPPLPVANPVSVSLAPWDTTVSITDLPDGGKAIRASTNHELADAGYALQIFDVTTHQRLAACYDGKTCGADDIDPAHDFVAYVASDSEDLPVPDIQSQAIPGRSDRHTIPVTLSESAAMIPTGDLGDAVLTPTGDAFRDMYFAALMQVYNEAHTAAVYARGVEVKAMRREAAVSLDLSGFRGELNTEDFERSALSIVGGGPAGGTGRADIAAVEGPVTSLWEVKYDSLWGQAAAPLQLARYHRALADSGILSINGFKMAPNSYTMSSGLRVNVHSGLVAGTELYDVEGGQDEIDRRVRVILENNRITEEDSRLNRLTESEPDADGSCRILLNGEPIFVLERQYVHVPVIVTVP